MKKYFSTIPLVLLVHLNAYSQADIHFSQFYETIILRNPALLGVSSDNFRVSAYFRNQWSSVTNPYQTGLFDCSYRIKVAKSSSDFLTIGLLAYMDQAGDLNASVSGIYPAINFNKSLSQDNNTYLSVGFTSGYLQYSFDPTLATFNNQFQGGLFNPLNPSNDNLPTPKFSIFDIGVGINYNRSPNLDNDVVYIIGVSGYHFTQPSFSYYNHKAYTENIRWNVNGAFIKEISTKWAMQLHANYAQQGAYNEIIGGGLLGWREKQDEQGLEFWFGSMYRFQDAIIPVIKLKYQNVGIGFSYDVNISSLQKASNMQGGYELTLNIAGNIPKSPTSYGKTVCPRF